MGAKACPNQNPWTANEPRLDDPWKRTYRNPCKSSNNTWRRKSGSCRNNHGPSKIPINNGHTFCQSSQLRNLSSKRSWERSTRSSSKSRSRTQITRERIRNFSRSSTGKERHIPGSSQQWIPIGNQDEILGYLNQMPADMLTHLQNQGEALEFADMKTLLVEWDGECDASEVPRNYFNRVEKAIQGLTRAGINSDLNEWHDTALYYLIALGEFDRLFENGNKGQQVKRLGNT